MTFLAPRALAFGAVAVAALVALHLLARRRPRALALPTARFVPERPTRLLSRTLALNDRWLLLLRALAVAALALAFARPVMMGRRAPMARVVLVDRSRDVASLGELRDSARTAALSGATLVAFDSGASRLTTPPDSIRLSGAHGSLSAGLLAAIRAGVDIAPRADSVELVVVSPLARREGDAATAAIAAAWPWRIRIVRVAARTPDTTAHAIDVRAPAGDAVAAALSLGVRSTAEVRLVRDAPTSADSAWAGAAARRVLVVWPTRGLEAGGMARPSGVVSGAAAVVARFGVSRPPAPGRAVARWADGAPAATERADGAGCIRDVAIPIDERSDLTVRPPFRALLAELVAPCGESGLVGGGRRDAGPLLVRRAGRLASGRELAASADERSPLAPLLLAVGILLLLAEWLVRLRVARAASATAIGERAAPVPAARERSA